MTHRLPRASGSSIIAGLFCVLAFVGLMLFGQDESLNSSPFVVYLDDGPFVTHQMIRDGVVYLPLVDLTRRLALPYTDATAEETLTIRGPNGTLIATADDRTVLIDGEMLELPQAAFREDGSWLAPLEFVEQGLGRITGTAFRRREESPRLIAGNLAVTSLSMAATQTDDLTRLTIQSGASINVRVQQNQDENRVILAIDRAPIDPVSEALDYRDNSIRSIRFDDSDGHSKIVIETTPQLANVRLLPMDENRTFLVEFVPETASIAVSEPNANTDRSRVSPNTVRVIVIDPGHGGLDSGTSAHGVLEKDLSLAFARRLRQALQARLDSTVILTRDQDRALSGEIRASIANSNEADLLISLHIGFSLDPSESGGSLFVMKPMTPAVRTGAASDVLFKRWYNAQSDQLETSRAFAETMEEELSIAIPGLQVAIREAPLGILISATMPAVLVEIGNANNIDDLNALSDPEFQDRWIGALAEAVARFDGAENEVF